MIGDHNSFKTVMLKYIFPLLFGGRSAKADPLFDQKASDFNSETFSAEFLFIDDTHVMRSDHRSRTITGHIMKDLTVGHGQGHHGKGKDRVSIRPWWVIMRSMNMEPETLATLPTDEDGTEDKYITLLFRSLEGGPIDMGDPGWFDELLPEIVAEVPALLHYLLYEHKAPVAVLDKSGRYPVMSYKNPTITAAVSESSVEQSVYNHIFKSPLFDCGFDDDEPKTYWEGPATELYDILCETGTNNIQARFRKMCPTPIILVAQLRILEKAHPHQILYSKRGKTGKKKMQGNYFWRIYPPTNLEADDCF